jgi:hypothetical protein
LIAPTMNEAAIIKRLTVIRDLDLATLPRVTWADRYGIPKGAGLYFAFLGDEFIYVGKASSIQSRIKQHHVIGPLCGDPRLRLSYLLIAKSWAHLPHWLLPLAEQFFISQYRPRLNQTVACSPHGCYGRYFNNVLGEAISKNYTYFHGTAYPPNPAPAARR